MTTCFFILIAGWAEGSRWNGRDGIRWRPHTSAEDRIARRNGGCDKTGAVRITVGNATGDCHDDAHHAAGNRNGPSARRSQATFEG